MKKLICPKCDALNSAVIKQDGDPKLDLPYNSLRDSDDWYDFLSEMIGEENDKVVIYCEYCKHEGEITDFEVEEPIKSDFEIMIPYVNEKGRPDIEYFRCKDYKEFQQKIHELAKYEMKYVNMIRANPIPRIRQYPLNWDGISLSDVLMWRN